MASRKKELDLSVRLKYKDGTVKEYANLEDAAMDSDLTAASIKIRANSGNTGKDGISCEWINETTKRHFMGLKSRRSGHDYERLVVKELTELGFKGLVTSRSLSRRLDDAGVDIAETEDKLSSYLLCKHTSKIPNMSQIYSKFKLKDRPLVVMWKGKYELVTIPKEYFYKLLSTYDRTDKGSSK